MIVFLLDSLGLGGSERTAINLFLLIKKYIDYTDISWIIISRKDKRISPKNYKYDLGNVNYIYNQNYSRFQKFIFLPITLYKISQIFKTIDPKVVFSFHDYSNLVNVILKNKFNYTSIISERRYAPTYFGKKYIIAKQFLKIIFKNADKIVVNDKEIEEVIIKDFKKDYSSKIYVLTNLLYKYDHLVKEEGARFSNDIYNLNDNVTFITVGRFTKEKNISDIIVAFSKIQNEKYKLVIIGDGPERVKLENLTKKLRIIEKVYFVGQVYNVYDYLNRADIFVFSSLTEGFPNVLLEAMYAGLPIISYNFKAGINTITDGGKYGVLVPLKDVETLARKMEEMAEDPELRKKYATLSKERVKVFMNLEDHINKIKSLLFNE